jgi:prepilin-type N-terminal cleavage/methylation domain-containing protein
MNHANQDRRCTARRGFTLIELMVSTVVLTIVMAGALGAMIANQRQFAAQSNLTATQANVRYGFGQIEKSLLRAGFGIDPGMALEPWARSAAGTEIAGQQRDNSGPFDSDELVVQYADPGFRREITSVGSGGFVLDRALAPGENLSAGQRLLVLCSTASDFAYVTVSGYTANTRQVTLAAAPPAPFNQQGKLDGSCFGDNGTLVRRVERRHYFIAWFTEFDGQTRPALMVRRGLDLDGDGTANETPDGWPAVLPFGGSAGDSELVALDVEQLQVAYVINRPSADLANQYGLTTGPDADNNFVFGDSDPPDVPSADAPVWSGMVTAPSPLAPPALNDPNCAALIYGISHCGYGGARRFTGHPGNVRTVRFTLVGRSGQEIPELTPIGPEDEAGLIENKPEGTGDELTRHRRVRLTGSISLRNVFQMKHFVPPDSNFDGA